MKKKSKQSIALLGLSLYLVSTSFAQRSIDVEGTLVSPASGQEIVVGQSFNVVLQAKNNGPDNLIKGDTIIILLGSQVIPILLERELLVGDGGDLINGSTSVGEGSALGPRQFCLEITDINATGFKNGNGEAVKVSYDDPNPDNNLVCKEITIIASGSTSSIAQEPSMNDEVRLFPNPAIEDVTIEIGKQPFSALKISVSDISGRILMTRAYSATAVKNGRVTLNINSLPAGMFVFNLQFDAQSIVRKITVMR